MTVESEDKVETDEQTDENITVIHREKLQSSDRVETDERTDENINIIHREKVQSTDKDCDQVSYGFVITHE